MQLLTNFLVMTFSLFLANSFWYFFAIFLCILVGSTSFVFTTVTDLASVVFVFFAALMTFFSLTMWSPFFVVSFFETVTLAFFGATVVGTFF